MSKQVFEGLRVLDFGRFIAAPWCAAIFADLGADVIRVERREGGEDRYVQSLDIPDGSGAGYLPNNRGKRGITLDTSTGEGRKIAHELVKTADVVIVNMPDRVMEAHGLDYETLKSVKPDIILASATAYGRSGPYSNRIGFDGIGQVMSGAVYRTGPEEQPYRFMVPYVDYATAQNLAIATMAAIVHRDRTGEGQHVEASLLLSALAVSDALLIDQAILEADHGRIGNRGLAVGPCDLFNIEGRWILVQVTGTPLFHRWCKMVGEEGWMDDPRFLRDEQRASNGVILNARMQEWCDTQKFDDAMAVLEENRIPAAEVLAPRQVLEQEHIKAMGYLKPVDYPGLSKPAPVIQTPFEMSKTPGRIAMRAPLLGEHNADVLGELGYDETAIAGLKEQGII